MNLLLWVVQKEDSRCGVGCSIFIVIASENKNLFHHCGYCHPELVEGLIAIFKTHELRFAKLARAGGN